MSHVDDIRSQATQAVDTMNHLIDSGAVLTATAAADVLGYTHHGIMKMVNARRITDLSIGRAHFVLASEIDDYLARKEEDRVTR